MRFRFLLAIALLSASVAARADVIGYYQLSGTEESFAYDENETINYPDQFITGSMSVDLDTQTILSFESDPSIPGIGVGTQLGGLTDPNCYSDSYFCEAISLTSFQVLDAYGHETFSDGSEARVDNYYEGTVTAVATTPEPSSLLLMGTGLLGMVGVARKRFTNTRAASTP